MTDQFSPADLRGFHEAAQSLRLYRRADLTDPESGDPLIAGLYVDPLPAEQIFQTALRPNTTFLIGRKGTGKSTIFQRLQFELRSIKHQTTAYVDIKTVYESAQVDPELAERVRAAGGLSDEALRKLLLHREFLKEFVFAIKEELKRRVASSMWSSIRENITGSHAELFEALNALLEDAEGSRFVSVLGIKVVTNKDSQAANNKATAELGGKGKVGVNPNAEINGGIKVEDGSSTASETAFTDVLMTAFNTKELLLRLKELLQRLGIRNLYLLIDDFSELPEDAMQTIVDVLLAPLNNWSDEFIKLKIAAYPGRIYYGQIDKTKIDEIYLDVYQLYGRSDVSRMEEAATEFTERLARSRLDHFIGKGNHTRFFDGEPTELWRTLFFATMGNPRNLGYLLHFLYEGNLIHQRKINRRSISEAARRYYEEKIEPYFGMGKFLHESFEERSSIFSLKELLESFVDRARQLRTHESSVFRQVRETTRESRGRPPTSHFHVTTPHEQLLSSLELNFFLTKYFEMSDRDGRKVSVYALNYGLCDKYTISFGRPAGEREFRLYFVERVFDFTPLITAYMANNQEILCDHCATKHPLEQIEALKLFNFRCPSCMVGTCHVINLSRKYESSLRAVNDELLLPRTELGILQTLSQEDHPLRAGAIAAELDCSYQLVGRRGRFLADRGLVDRAKSTEGVRLFSITADAKSTYFPDSGQDDLHVKEEK